MPDIVLLVLCAVQVILRDIISIYYSIYSQFCTSPQHESELRNYATD